MMSLTRDYIAPKWLDDNEVERIWKMLSQHNVSTILAVGTQGIHTKPVRTIGVPAKIQAGHLLNISQKNYCLRQMASFSCVILEADYYCITFLKWYHWKYFKILFWLIHCTGGLRLTYAAAKCNRYTPIHLLFHMHFNLKWYVPRVFVKIIWETGRFNSRIKWAWHVASMGKWEINMIFWNRKPQGNRQLTFRSEDNIKMYFRTIRYSGELVWTMWWMFAFH
jgi:hypothetical protein